MLPIACLLCIECHGWVCVRALHCITMQRSRVWFCVLCSLSRLLCCMFSARSCSGPGDRRCGGARGLVRRQGGHSAVPAVGRVQAARNGIGALLLQLLVVVPIRDDVSWSVMSILLSRGPCKLQRSPLDFEIVLCISVHHQPLPLSVCSCWPTICTLSGCIVHFLNLSELVSQAVWSSSRRFAFCVLQHRAEVAMADVDRLYVDGQVWPSVACCFFSRLAICAGSCCSAWPPCLPVADGPFVRVAPCLWCLVDARVR